MPRVTKTVYAANEMSVTNAPANYGNGRDNHMPIGYSASTGWRYRGLVKFWTGAGTIPNGARLVSVTLKMKTTGSTAHMRKGAGVKLRIGRLVSAFDSTIGDGETWQSSGGTTGFIGLDHTITYPGEGQHKDGTVYEYDVTSIWESVVHRGAFKRDGSPCDGIANNGIGIRNDNEDTDNDSTEFWSTKGGYDLRVVVVYDLEDAPPAAVITEPVDTQSSVPTEFAADIPDGTAVEARFKVSTVSETGPWDLWEEAYGPCVSGAEERRAYAGSTLPVGQTLYFKVDTRNGVGDVVGSVPRSFYINATPTTGITLPGPDGLAHVYNLPDAQAWDDATGWARPRLTVQYDHPTGLAAERIEVRIDGATVEQHDTTIPAGESRTVDLDIALVRDTVTTCEVRALAGGVWSDWSPVVSFRVNWAQAVWTVPDVAGAGGLTAVHDGLEGGGLAQVAYLYRAQGDSVWSQQLSDIVPSAGGIEVLIRMSTSDVAQQPALPAWRIRYDTAGDAQPDHWGAAGATLRLDANFRRFGVNSLRVEPTGGAGHVRGLLPVVVSPETKYTASVFINTHQPMTNPVTLAAWDGGGDLLWTATAETGSTKDSQGDPAQSEGWLRIYDTFDSGSASEVYVGIVFDATDESFNIDSFQHEEGQVASQWAPGGLGPAVVLDVGGIAVDASAGGVFRLKAATGEVIQLYEDRLITTRDRSVGDDPRQLGMFWRGIWHVDTPYTRDDVVSYDDGSSDGSYIALRDSAGVTPGSSPDDWLLIPTPTPPTPPDPEPILHVAKRFRTSDTDIPNTTNTTVPMNAADIIGGAWNDLFAQEHNGILVKRECYIKPAAAVHYHGTNTTGRRSWYLYHHHASGGADVVAGETATTTSNQYWHEFTGPILHVMPNDYFTIDAYHNANATVAVVGDAGTWLQAELIKEVV